MTNLPRLRPLPLRSIAEARDSRSCLEAAIYPDPDTMSILTNVLETRHRAGVAFDSIQPRTRHVSGLALREENQLELKLFADPGSAPATNWERRLQFIRGGGSRR